MVKWQSEELFGRVPRHSYCKGIIILSMLLIMVCGISYRACERVLRVLFGKSVKLPKRITLMNWTFKIGLYELERKVEKAEDWIFILDVTHGFGHQKCLVVLGLRLSDYESIGFSWSYRAMKPLAIVPCQTVNGDLVHQTLIACQQKVGKVLQIISDKGPDVYKGVQLFLDKNKSVVWIYDIGHQMAILLKKLLKEHSLWQGFLKAVKSFRNRCQETVTSFLCPSKQRAKARYMNVGLLTNWATSLYNYIAKGDFSDIPLKLTAKEEKEKDKMTDKALKKWTAQKQSDYIKGRLGDLVNYQKTLPFFSCAWEMTKLTNTIIKTNKLSLTSIEQVRQALNQFIIPQDWKEELLPFRELIITSLKENLPVSSDETATYVATSDIIESLFGKFKASSSHGTFVGLTQQVLTLATFTFEPTEDNIIDAVTKTKMEDIKKWKEDNLPTSIHAKKMEIFDRRKRQNQTKLKMARKVEMQPKSDRILPETG